MAKKIATGILIFIAAILLLAPLQAFADQAAATKCGRVWIRKHS
jgi:hypothetical protein